MSSRKSHGFMFGCVAVAGCSLVAAIPAKAQTPGPGELLKADRPLQPDEIERVMEAVTAASEGKAFRLYDFPGSGGRMPPITVLMGATGRPRYVHQSMSVLIEEQGTEEFIAEYTGRPARSCDGHPLEGELEIGYLWRSRDHQWEIVTGVPEDARDPYEKYFQILSSKVPVESGGRATVGGRSVRLLIAPWKDLRLILMRDEPAVDLQVLAIDVETLLPVRWETVAKRTGFRSGVVFAFDPSTQIELPTAIERPDCVSGSRMFSVR